MLELHNVLNKMDVILQELTELLRTEQLILIENSLAHSLSNVIDSKSQLLLDLKRMDDKRIAVGKQHNVQEPYTEYDSLAIKWNAIVKTTAQLSQVNRDNGSILQTRMDKTQQAITFFRKLNNASFYNNGGYTQAEPVSTKRAEA